MLYRNYVLNAIATWKFQHSLPRCSPVATEGHWWA